MSFYSSDLFQSEVDYAQSSGGMLDELGQTREAIEWRPSGLLRLSAAIAISGLISVWVPGRPVAASDPAAALRTRAVVSTTGGTRVASARQRQHFSSPPVGKAALRRVAVMDRLFVQSPENDLDDPDHGI